MEFDFPDTEGTEQEKTRLHLFKEGLTVLAHMDSTMRVCAAGRDRADVEAKIKLQEDILQAGGHNNPGGDPSQQQNGGSNNGTSNGTNS